jgi:exoribonuclease-2
MNTGDIVEFPAKDGHTFGVITRKFGSEKLGVQTADGTSMRTKRDEVTFHKSANVDGTDASIERALDELESSIDEYRQQFDLEFVWEFTSGSEAEYSASELGELFFDESSPHLTLAVEQILRDNNVYFTSGKDGYVPRSESKVEKLKRQKRIEQRRKQKLQDFVDKVGRVIDASDDGERLHENFMEEDNYSDFIDKVKDYALRGSESPDEKRISKVLDRVEENITDLKANDELRAFWLLVELGVWDRHENLKLRQSDYTAEPDPEILEEAETLAAESVEFDDERVDLTDWTAFSVDDASTKDVDDAISVRPTEEGWRLAIHIADPDAFVEPGSTLDEYARQRASSVYLPRGNISMFPSILSQEKMSLNAGQMRPAVTTLFDVTEDYQVELTNIEPSVVEVDQAITYDEVDAVLDEDESIGDPFDEALKVLRNISLSRQQRRKDNGATTIDIPDIHIDVDRETTDIDVWAETETTDGIDARAMIGECMILNNEAIGTFCEERDLPVIYRNQSPPNSDLNSDEITSYPEGIARKFQKVYRLNPGVMSTNAENHFGLGIEGYAQASSPIRRFIDLVCQRQLKSFKQTGKAAYGESEIVQLLGELQPLLDDVQYLQREAERYWTLVYFDRHDDKAFEATVLDLNNADGTHADIFIDELAFKTTCRFREDVEVGQRVTVCVNYADPHRDHVSLQGEQLAGR